LNAIGNANADDMPSGPIMVSMSSTVKNLTILGDTFSAKRCMYDIRSSRQAEIIGGYRKDANDQ
jgi:hypothetical protein